MSTRLFVILARAAPVAVVLRRGPWKEVLLVRWDRGGDLLLASDGRLQRLAVASAALLGGEPRALVDVLPLTFVQRPPDPAAAKWIGTRPKGVVVS